MEAFRTRARSESGLAKKLAGFLAGVVVDSHTSGTLKFINGTSDGVAASGTLTSSGAMVPADYARGTLTSDATAVADGAQVVVGTKTYVAKTAFTPGGSTANEVLIGSTANGAAFLANLKKAINADPTGAGSVFSPNITANADIIAGAVGATTLVVWARVIGTGGNALATTETSSHLSWGAATLASGVTDAGATITIDSIVYTVTLTLPDSFGLTVANQILWVTSEAVFLDNLKAAINGAGVPGTDYSVSTPVHPTVYATTNTNTTQLIVAKQIGTQGNSIATTETLANYAWGAATLASGTGNTGTVMFDTITFASGPQTVIFPKPVVFESLYIVAGGTIVYSPLID